MPFLSLLPPAAVPFAFLSRWSNRASTLIFAVWFNFTFWGLMGAKLSMVMGMAIVTDQIEDVNISLGTKTPFLSHVHAKCQDRLGTDIRKH